MIPLSGASAGVEVVTALKIATVPPVRMRSRRSPVAASRLVPEVPSDRIKIKLSFDTDHTSYPPEFSLVEVL